MQDEKHPIHNAADTGDIDQLRAEISKGTDLNILDDFKRTPLALASRSGHKECVLYLLSLPNINIIAESCFGEQAIHQAAKQGHKEILNLLSMRPEISKEAKKMAWKMYNHKKWSGPRNFWIFIKQLWNGEER